MKRSSLSAESSPALKKQKTEYEIDPQKINSIFQSVSAVQEKLSDVDRKIAKQQARIELDFASEKKALFEQRDALLDKDENFWALILTLHPEYAQSVIPHEIELMRKHLKTIHVNDHLDANGSYEVVFSFKENDVFSPSELRKKVIFTDDGSIDVAKSEAMDSISFVKPEDDPRELIKKMYSKEEEHADNCGCDDCDDDDVEGSMFQWFCEKDEENSATLHFGEIVRRHVYPQPEEVLLAAHMDMASDGSDDDSDEAEADTTDN